MKNIKVKKSITDRSEKALDIFLKEISKIPLLLPSEEIKLAKAIKAGNKLALDKLVTSNLRFVVSVAKQYQNQGLSLGDLVNEGSIGLIRAAEKFDIDLELSPSNISLSENTTL
jgi:RNA polymerase primary sigma factor